MTSADGKGTVFPVKLNHLNKHKNKTILRKYLMNLIERNHHINTILFQAITRLKAI